MIVLIFRFLQLINDLMELAGYANWQTRISRFGTSIVHVRF